MSSSVTFNILHKKLYTQLINFYKHHKLTILSFVSLFKNKTIDNNLVEYLGGEGKRIYRAGILLNRDAEKFHIAFENAREKNIGPVLVTASIKKTVCMTAQINHNTVLPLSTKQAKFSVFFSSLYKNFHFKTSEVRGYSVQCGQNATVNDNEH